MALLVGLALALFVLPSPWGVVAVVAGAALEFAEAAFLWRLSHRRDPAVGTGTLVGADAVTASPCTPYGQVRVNGEIWQARCDAGAGEGETVRVREVDGLTLVVEPR